PVAMALPDGRTVQIGYDTAGRASTVTFPGGGIAFAYASGTGRLASATSTGGQVVTYGYNGTLPTSETWSGPVGGQVRWNYDKFQKLVSERVQGGSTVSFGYEADGLMTNAGALTIVRDSVNGLPSTTALRGANDTFGYDAFGKVTSYAAKYQSTTLWNS